MAYESSFGIFKTLIVRVLGSINFLSKKEIAGKIFSQFLITTILY